MKQVLIVFLGGGVGSALRFLISRELNQLSSIPLGTFLVNILGSLLIGVILGLGMKQQLFPTSTTLLLATGFCGGFTTFSAFSYENQVFLKAGDLLNMGLYTIGTFVLGISAVFVGLYLARSF